MSGGEGHYGSVSLDKLHKTLQGKTENGACLTGHEGNFSKFKNKNTCNYRYQGYEQASALKKIRDRLHSYKSITIKNPLKTSAYKTDAGGRSPAYYCASLPIPQDGDWDIGGPLRDITRKTFTGNKVKIPTGYNFTQDTWPYWNNAHHLIPKGTLKARILEETTQVAELIQVALLKAKYNINHKINMLLMPQDREVATVLNLPRHIQLKDNDEPNLDAMCTDHPVYNQMVREMRAGLDSIIKNYKRICDEAIKKVKGTHKKPKADLDKTKLERLSKKLLQTLLDWGAGMATKKKKGRSLDAMAKARKP